MSDKSNKYGYVGVDIPAQSFGNNKGIFNPAEINELVADNKWTQYGQLELIETQTVSSVSELNLQSIKENIYNVHFLTFNNFSNSTDNAILGIRLYENGTLETGSVYHQAYQEYTGNGTFAEAKSTTNSSIRISENTGNATNETNNGYVYLYNLGDNTKYSFITAHNSGIYTDGNYIGAFGSGVLPQASTVNGISIDVFNVTSSFSGTFSLYGIRYS